MGFKNIYTTFMCSMNDILDSIIVVFLDNILMYSHIMKEYFSLLEKVLACLYQYIFYCKLKKCSFLHNNIMFLGFNVTTEDMEIGDSDIKF